MGIDCDSKDIRIYRLQDGGYFAAPESAEISMEYVEMEDGSMKLEPVIVARPDSLLVESDSRELPTDFQTQSGEYWNLVGNQAFARFEDGKGWMDHAYKMHKLVVETIPNKDYYQLEHWATAKSKGAWTLYAAHVWCQKQSSSSPMEWVDWDPQADQDYGSGGQSVTIGISYIVEISSTYTVRDKWDITKYAEAGKFKNSWRGSAWRSERNVAYMICVSVPEGGWPAWTLSAQYTTFL